MSETALSPADDRAPTDSARTPGLPLDRARAAWEAQAARVPAPSGDVSREEAMDRARLVEQFDLERAAIASWSQRVSTQERDIEGSVLVLHRYEWLGRRLHADLRDAGLVVLPPVADSAEAVAALVVAQPSVMLMSDRVPGCLGTELVQRARELSPRTRCVVHVDADDRMQQAIDSGARAVLSHRQSTQEIVARLQHLAAR